MALNKVESSGETEDDTKKQKELGLGLIRKVKLSDYLLEKFQYNIFKDLRFQYNSKFGFSCFGGAPGTEAEKYLNSNEFRIIHNLAFRNLKARLKGKSKKSIYLLVTQTSKKVVDETQGRVADTID